jgi:ribosomal protein S18 acetylase RimI-like enzyme
MTVPSLRFLPLQRDLCGELLDLMNEYYAYDHLDFVIDRARGAVDAMLEDPALARCWIITADDRTAGYCVLGMAFSLEFHGRTGFLDELYLKEPYRGKGIGRSVVDFVCGEARTLRLHALRLEVERDNTRAGRLYDATGFRRHQRDLMTKWLDGGVDFPSQNG